MPEIGITDRCPLVSIIVITYNSAKYVLETLESAKAQTYKNIELIVSDDCSTDDTIKICNDWIMLNKNRFIRTEIITALKNNGIPNNCNKGIRAAKGEWIKLIAGDDLLKENCIQDNIDFSRDSIYNIDVIHSIRITFRMENNEKKILWKTNPNSIFNEVDLNALDQYQLSLRRISCPANTLFIRKEVFSRVNWYDEEFPLIEDWPFMLKFTKNEIKTNFLNKETVEYRIHHESVFNKETNNFLYTDWYFNSYIPVVKKYVLQNLSVMEKLAYKYQFILAHLFNSSIINKRNLITRIINTILTSPSKLIYNISRRNQIKKISKKYNLIKYV